MTPPARLQAALEKPDPTLSLRAVVIELAAEGYQNREIQGLLEGLFQALRDCPDHREADEDAVLDVLNGLAGWCQVDAQLLANDGKP